MREKVFYYVHLINFRQNCYHVNCNVINRENVYDNTM
jgi:hypothetical protein